MSLEYKNSDFVLCLDDKDKEVMAVVNKYDAFLDAITTPDFEHVREAVCQAVHFFVSKKYNTTKELANENYRNNKKLQSKYEAQEDYLGQFKILDKKSVSIDLATGTGKSWVIFGVAQIMLAEGLVDKVLVLCPSLTIEEELTKKFQKLSGNRIVTRILKELGSLYPAPAIKSANNPILNGDICVENIHAAYERTGSSIEDSFKGKGQRTLVISDEAHHIYSEANADVKKWYQFLTNKDYDFGYLLGLSGTPYIKNDYFHDIIYRYGLRQATEEEIVKRVDYKLEEADQEKGFQETYVNHQENWEKYGEVLKPISIVITDRIFRCVQVWDKLVEFLVSKEDISRKEAEYKVIWVTSGIPNKKHEKNIIESIVSEPEKKRKENIALLKTVDESDNPVEWIVSVSMLTEGWDVKNVFQIVPHERKAFDSKLLISQVLGRGLRIPPKVEKPVYVKINNHEKWTDEIKRLYEEVLEIEDRILWGHSSARSKFDFQLFNLEYVPVQDTVESKKKVAAAPELKQLKPQYERKTTDSEYSESGTISFDIEIHDNVTLDSASRQIKLFLKDKDVEVANRWPLKKIKGFIKKQLDDKGYHSDFVSKDNLSLIKQAFGPMFRELDKENPRIKLKPDVISPIPFSQIQNQSFAATTVMNQAKVYYCPDSINSLEPKSKSLFNKWLEDKNTYDTIKRALRAAGVSEDRIKYLKENIIDIDKDKYKTPLSIIYASHEPEQKFIKTIFNYDDLIDSFIKSPDKGFYQLPYSYKPTEEGSTHVKRDNFNPDFFFKLKGKNEILVVEIKAEGDSSQKNKAKYRDGKEHFEELNKRLKRNKKDWAYHFYFLSPENYSDFFQAVRDNKYTGWKSELMQELE